MSGIVLSSSVRQNLLSLQSTADLLATTQNRLATGKKVNTALDNPTNYFTAASLDNRASDINNLLDGIGNGVQVLQAANTGITSLQSLVDSAKSVATQALQATVGYSAKSSVSVSINGATADNLLGTGAAIDATVSGSNVVDNQAVYTASTGVGTAIAATNASAYQAGSSTGTTSLTATNSTAITSASAGSVSLDSTSSGTKLAASTLSALSGKSLTVNGQTITFDASATSTSTSGSTTTIGLGAGTTSTAGDILSSIQSAAGAGASVDFDSSGKITISTGAGTDVNISGTAASVLGVSTTLAGASTGTTSLIDSDANAVLTADASSISLDSASSGTSLDASTLTALAGKSLTINGKTITFDASATSTSTSGSTTTIGLGAGTDATVDTILSSIQDAAGTGASVGLDSSGNITIATGAGTDVNISGDAATVLGVSTTLAGSSTGTSSLTAAETTAVTSASASTISLDSGSGSSLDASTLSALSGTSLTVNGQTITFDASATSTSTSGTTTTIGLGAGTSATVGDILSSIQSAAGTGASVSLDSTGKITIATGTASDVTIGGSAASVLGVATTDRTANASNSSAITTGNTLLNGVATAGGTDGLTSGLTTSDSLTVNNKTISFNSGTTTTGSIADGNLSIGIGAGSNANIDDLLDAISSATGGTATIDASGKINLTSSTSADISLTGSNSATLAKLGLSGAATTTVTRTEAAAPAITSATTLSGAASSTSDSLTTSFGVGDTISVNGQNLTFTAAGSGTSDSTHIQITDTVGNLLSKIDALSGNTGTGATASTVTDGHVVLHTGTSSDLKISSSNSAAFAALGFSSAVSTERGTGTSTLDGETLSIGSTGGGTVTNLTFGSGAGQIKSLNDLNTALGANNLQATLSSNGTLTITTSNDAASSTIGTISGTAAATGSLFNGLTASSAVVDADATATRNNLVTQYNNILNQISSTAQDASFNGVNLLSGDTLKLTFNETGKSTLSIGGVNFNAAGLGLSTLNSGDFKDNDSVNKVVAGLTAASGTLRSQASSFGSNLSIVQIRQDFSKNLINVLQTGSSNLTLADTNEEAANSQALSTRQSIAVSALALANQSQQSVLQLLR